MKEPPEGGFFVPPTGISMIIVPAIDLKGGKCVRLRQGRMDSATIFGDDPAAMAQQWAGMGAARMHVVDLDGSVEGRPATLESIQKIVQAIDIPVQVGGGIRDADIIRQYVDVGVETVILGTIAARNPQKVMEYISTFPGRVAVGIDARSGMVAVQGWTEGTELRAAELASMFAQTPPSWFIYTDIERDGMMQGPNIEATRAFAQSTATPVILSGGVTSMADVERILPLEEEGVRAIIIGRALYEGAIDLREVVNMVG
jgi:phosphoribosylformimino-5-aminoimidazole carboxamide ribotide isomerase